MICYNCKEEIMTSVTTLGYIRYSNKDCPGCGNKLYVCQYCFLIGKLIENKIPDGKCLTCRRDDKLNVII